MRMANSDYTDVHSKAFRAGAGFTTGLFDTHDNAGEFSIEDNSDENNSDFVSPCWSLSQNFYRPKSISGSYVPHAEVQTRVMMELIGGLDAAEYEIFQVSETSTRSTPHAFISGVSTPLNSVNDKFALLADAWDEHNAGRPIVDYFHFSHLQIIGMGEIVIPLILERFLDGDPRWVFSLKCISGQQPDSSESQNDLNVGMKAWSDWGKRNVYIR